MELGNDPEDQLYDLKTDPFERNNISKLKPKVVEELKNILLKELDK